MERKDIRNKLMRITVFMVAGILVLFGIASSVLLYINNTMHETIHEQMEQEASEYKTRLIKQIETDFEILHTLAAFIEYNGINDRETLAEGLNLINQKNSFITIALIDKNGKGVISTEKPGATRNFFLSQLQEPGKTAIERAMEGESLVSPIFISSNLESQIYTYNVPVYNKKEIIGVLSASDKLEKYEDILKGNTVMGGNGYIHIIDSEGKFLVRSSKTVVHEQNMTSIFDGPYTNEKNRQLVIKALQEQKTVFSEFKYNNENYHFYIQPVGINGWYILCVNDLWGYVFFFRQILTVVGVSAAIMLLLMVFFMFHGYMLLKKSYIQLMNLAYFDRITGAGNIWQFQQKFETLQKKDENHSIVAVNIRNFKFINELYGENEGNKLLCYIKKVIEEHLHPDEFFCRDTADLFYILFKEISETKIRERLGSIIKQVSEITQNDKHGYETRMYCGVAVNGDMVHSILAMQSIKRNLGRDIAFCDENLYKKKKKESQIESHMQTALQNEQFKLFLQPKICLADGSLSGAEALVRWQTGETTFIPPSDFIPLFEGNGFCAKLDMYMVSKVCNMIRNWIDEGIKPIPISINQSKILFHENNYIRNLDALINRYGIPPSYITLEILEGLADSNIEEINMKIRQLHEKGFKVSMDDFGTGYSSLNTLYQLEIDELKIDQNFLREASTDKSHRRWIILEQIIKMSQKLGIPTVAEGIETKEDVDKLASLGCNYGQGFFYSKPISVRDFNKKYMG